MHSASFLFTCTFAKRKETTHFRQSSSHLIAFILWLHTSNRCQSDVWVCVFGLTSVIPALSRYAAIISVLSDKLSHQTTSVSLRIYVRFRRQITRCNTFFLSLFKHERYIEWWVQHEQKTLNSFQMTAVFLFLQAIRLLSGHKCALSVVISLIHVGQ